MKTQTRAACRLRIQWMEGNDLNAAFDLEQAANEHPWNALQFAETLFQPNSVGLVAVMDKTVVGYAIVQGTEDGIRIWRLAVSPEYQRRGIASRLIAHLVCKLTDMPKKQISLEVRESNLPTQLFLRSLGFKAVRIERDFYEDSHEDAYFMQYTHRSRMCVKAA